MERCPNCGAPARPGAKFCTTCGYRLPAITATEPPADDGGTASTGAASSWPLPPASATADSSASSADDTLDREAGSDEVITMPAPAPEPDGDPDAETAGDPEPADGSSTDSVLSSSWPSPAPPRSDPWATTNDASDETGTDDEAEVSVTEEYVVVPAPASQYEGWSAAVVEEVVPEPAGGGTTIARAIALVDELRLLLPALATGAGAGSDGSVVSEFEAILATSEETSGDRRALRDALNHARDNPRDIQTILALSQQADAAITLLDEHDRLVAAVHQALSSLKPKPPGISGEPTNGV
ncbi:MAG: zinc ribbon domain-containing protein [Chloroflexota bacterium]|nr:zinc ribbon domain-containing protein [Chloroflexota bacterium]